MKLKIGLYSQTKAQRWYKLYTFKKKKKKEKSETVFFFDWMIIYLPINMQILAFHSILL